MSAYYLSAILIVWNFFSGEAKSKKQLKKEAKDAEKASKKEAHKAARVSFLF